MQTLNLLSIPAQSFSARLDDIHVTIRIHEGNGTMLVDIIRDGETIIQSTRLIAGEPIIPFRYLETGNFILLTDNDELPDWQKFGTKQKLIYLTYDDIMDIQNGKV